LHRRAGITLYLRVEGTVDPAQVESVKHATGAVECAHPAGDCWLVLNAAGLSAQALLDGRTVTVRVDFAAAAHGRRLRSLGGHDPLAKAIGVRAGRRVLDATAGLGRDGFQLAYLGCSVRLIEVVSAVHALLADGLRRAGAVEALQATTRRLSLTAADAIAWLGNGPGGFDVAYIDAMFEQRRRARATKPMRVVAAILAASEVPATRAEALRDACLRAGVPRVVVKRKRHAPLLPGAPPHHRILGRTLRFDVYGG